jgi:hypothetical protein
MISRCMDLARRTLDPRNNELGSVYVERLIDWRSQGIGIGRC